VSLNILSKRAAEVADLAIKNADGSPMLDESNNPITATVFGPATKIWQVANSLKRRKGVKRTREANGKTEAYFDNEDEDIVEFLCTVTKRFNGLNYPGAEGEKAIVEAVYKDPQLGFIRDHMEADTRNWENFMKASQAPSTDGSASTSG
jgi:hypothetical protein